MGTSPDGESDVYSIEIKCPSSEKAMTQYIKSGNSVLEMYGTRATSNAFFI